MEVECGMSDTMRGERCFAGATLDWRDSEDVPIAWPHVQLEKLSKMNSGYCCPVILTGKEHASADE